MVEGGFDGTILMCITLFPLRNVWKLAGVKRDPLSLISTSISI